MSLNILHIDTATSVCSVALSENGVLKAYRDHEEPNIHASKLTLLIDDLMREAGCEMGQLHAVAVSKGPGSYTGLRIGVSAAKGICFALDIPLLAVATLDALAEGFLKEQGMGYSSNTLFCPMLDARRMEVYSAIYHQDKSLVAPTGARIIDEHAFEAYSASSIVLFGEGANKLRELFEGHPFVQVVGGFRNSARYLVQEAADRYQREVFEDLAYFEPFYLKDFIPTTPKKRISIQ